MMGLGIFGFILLIFAMIGWVLNIVKLIQCAGGGVTGMLIIRIIGIFVAPLGCIMGYISNGAIVPPSSQPRYTNNQQQPYINSPQSPATPQPFAKFCNGCGGALEAGVVFCSDCGKRIAA